MLSAWEPLVEPVEIAEGHWKSWTMGLMVRSHSDEELVASRGARPQGKHSLTIQADCPLEITLTKSLLRLLVDLVDVNVARAEIQTICLQHPTETDHEWKMVVETKVEDTRHIIILRSILQFENHMSIPIEVYSASDGNFKLCSTIMPSERPVSIPLMSLCDSDCKLKLKPAKAGYDLSKESVCWLKFVDKERYVLRCKSTSEATEMLYVVLVVEETAAKPYNVTEFNDKVYLVHICSPVTVQNLLPFPVKVTSPVEHDLASSEQINLNTASGTRIKFEICYRGDIYSSSNIRFSSKPQNFEVVKFCSKKKKLNLGMRWITERGQMKAQIFASYWFVNNTGKTLKYMEGGIKRKSVSLILCRRREASHEAAAITQKPFTEPVLLPLSSRGFFNKKKAKVKIEESQWSNEFTLAAVGTTMRIKCKAADRDYEMSLDVYLSQSGLTKVVCFSPFFLIHNLSPLGVEIGQSGYDEWVKVEPQSTCYYSFMFPFTENFEGFCQIDNEYLGVYVTCCFGASSWIIRLEPFEAGMAPALIMNCTKERVRFSQKGSTAIRQLEPWECCMFTWSDVTQNRELEWQSGVHCHMDALLSNSFGIYKASPSSRSQYYWNTAKRELYIAIIPAPVIWEQLDKSGFKYVLLFLSLFASEILTIRRHHQPGLWFQYGQSAHQKQLHFKLSRLQVDNQLANCVFPTIVAVVPPPKSIVADNERCFRKRSRDDHPQLCFASGEQHQSS
ncbi:Vacuolar protein sorting-associated protein 13C [Toxocara canis]|uniref:Vacuolar protein sorting-associated protein 13C n=1 Tax=Toxocara canis TaxID=6265 RepID=A0A0B2V9B0_TOXCA|nr:Vacuolar protein sorting-associated protein 13C [Toxocara canis]